VVYFVPSALQYNVGLSSNLSRLVGGFVQTMFFFGSLVVSTLHGTTLGDCHLANILGIAAHFLPRSSGQTKANDVGQLCTFNQAKRRLR
jgi:hypothetical protein